LFFEKKGVGGGKPLLLLRRGPRCTCAKEKGGNASCKKEEKEEKGSPLLRGIRSINTKEKTLTSPQLPQKDKKEKKRGRICSTRGKKGLRCLGKKREDTPRAYQVRRGRERGERGDASRSAVADKRKKRVAGPHAYGGEEEEGVAELLLDRGQGKRKGKEEEKAVSSSALEKKIEPTTNFL